MKTHEPLPQTVIDDASTPEPLLPAAPQLKLMQKQTLPPRQPDGTGKPLTLTLADLSGKKVLCKTFMPGDTMLPHHAPTDVLVLVLDGQIDISLGDTLLSQETSRFAAGDYLLIPARTTHALACVEAARLLIYR